MLKDDAAPFERTTFGSGLADRISTPRPLLGAGAGAACACCPISFCGAVFPPGAAGNREGGESFGVASAVLEATAEVHSDGCCAAGWGRTQWLNAAECAVLNRLMLLGGRLFCHS